MPNQTDSLWACVPGLHDFAVQLVASRVAGRQLEVAISERFGVTLSAGAINAHLRKSGGVQRQATPIPSSAPIQTTTPVPGAQLDALKKILRGRPLSVTEIADHFDLSPKRVRELLAELHAAGYPVAVREDGGEARALLASEASETKRLSIDAEKFYGNGFRFDFGLVADTHLGSKFYREEVLNAIYDNFAQHGIKHVFHGGNYIEGEKDHNRFHLLCRPGMQGQIEYFVEKYPQREGITTYYVAGDDHEGWYQQREGIDIGRFTQSEAEKAGRHDLVNLGYMEADVIIRAPRGRCVLRVLHAGGGSAYAISYTAQKLIESLEGGEKPNILAIGHYHKSEYLFYRNVHCYQMGTTKAQDTFMRKKRLSAHVGGWRCSALLDETGVVVEMTSTFLPFFDRGFYETLALDVENDAVNFIGTNETYNVVRR